MSETSDQYILQTMKYSSTQSSSCITYNEKLHLEHVLQNTYHVERTFLLTSEHMHGDSTGEQRQD